MNDKTIRWILFSVIISMLPLFYLLIKTQFDSDLNTFDKVIQETLAHGDLILASSTLCATAIGELHYAKSNNLKNIKGFVLFLCLACFGAGLMYYPEIYTMQELSAELKSAKLESTSNSVALIYISSILSSTVSIILSEA